jgi:KilA-N domain
MNETALVVRRYNNTNIRQRAMDNYLDATAMCQATGKEFKHYRENNATHEFLTALSFKVGIPTFSDGTLPGRALVESRRGRNGGTWVHPYVAVNIAQWASPTFAVQVAEWVYEEKIAPNLPKNKVPTCEHKDRPVLARGLCAQCYHKTLHAERRRTNESYRNDARVKSVINTALELKIQGDRLPKDGMRIDWIVEM